MLIQLVLGGAIMVVTALVAAVALWWLELFLQRLRRWVTRPPQGPRFVVELVAVMLWTLLVMTVSVWIWALVLWALQIFVTLEASVYFSLVAFTTLGFGDILLPVEWRLLGGLAAANGLLMFGVLTAVLVEVLRRTRVRQREGG